MELRTQSRNHAPKLFPFLNDVATRDLIAGVYYTVRLLTHRNDIIDVKTGLRVPGVASEPTDRDAELALKLIQRMEEQEKISLKNFTEKQAGKYIIRLVGIMKRRTLREYGGTPEQGKELLLALRAEW